MYTAMSMNSDLGAGDTLVICEPSPPLTCYFQYDTSGNLPYEFLML